MIHLYEKKISEKVCVYVLRDKFDM